MGMGTFSASLRAIGDVKSLPAIVELADGILSIHAGDTEIGSWPLSEINLEETPTGYRLAAEGEQILLELKDLTSFATELNSTGKKRLSFGRKKSERRTGHTEVAGQPRPAHPEPTQVDEKLAAPGVPLAAKVVEKPKKAEKKSGWTAKGLALVDGTMARANKRLGPYLPEWMFTRAMFAIAFGSLILMLAVPGLVSVFLLIAGGVMVLFGAIVYSDTMLASRWLPGRSTPQHALLFGVAILMMGVLLGVIAK